MTRILKTLIISSALFAAGCGGIDAQMRQIGQDSLRPDPTILNRADPDFIPGEIVTTSNGFVIRGVVGEISPEANPSPSASSNFNPYESLNNNGWVIQGIISYNLDQN